MILQMNLKDHTDALGILDEMLQREVIQKDGEEADTGWRVVSPTNQHSAKCAIYSNDLDNRQNQKHWRLKRRYTCPRTGMTKPRIVVSRLCFVMRRVMR